MPATSSTMIKRVTATRTTKTSQKPVSPASRQVSKSRKVASAEEEDEGEFPTVLIMMVFVVNNLFYREYAPAVSETCLSYKSWPWWSSGTAIQSF